MLAADAFEYCERCRRPAPPVNPDPAADGVIGRWWVLPCPSCLTLAERAALPDWAWRYLAE